MIPKRPLGNTGLNVSILGYGGAPIGFADSTRQADFDTLVNRAVDLGINFFDTAPNYRLGERLLGAALVKRRRDVVLATKCGRIQVPNNNKEGWADGEDWSEQGVLKTVDDSLRDLKTDYLDLVQLHSPPRWVLDDGAALMGLQRAQEIGKIRHIGLSGDGPDALYAVELGAFATLQISYSMLEQEPGDIIREAARKGMGVIAKQPMANGIADVQERPPYHDWLIKWQVAQQIDWTALGAPGSRMELALRWVLANPNVGTAIVGTTRLEHLESNAVAASAPPLDTRAVAAVSGAYSLAMHRLLEVEP
jgi:aryl-alcohol dehydrogenase-like predicted oxidoreductase